MFFGSIDLPKIQKGDPYKMTNINFVQYCSNLAQFSKINNKQVAKIWSL